MTYQNNIFFSVIIPTRNRPKVMHEALTSVLNQTEKSIEIIVVNDGSDDQYASEYEQICQHKNITVLNLEQSLKGHGPSYALNMGVAIAKGKYIAFLDDDDQWSSLTHLTDAKARLSNNPADIYLTLQEAYKDNQLKDKSIWLSPLTGILNNKKTASELSVDTLIQCSGFAHRNNLIISKSLYKTVDGHDENLRYEEDREFYLRSIEQANKIIFVPEFISRHNIPTPKNNNLSNSYSEISKLRSRLYLFDSIITQSNNINIIEYAELQKVYTLKMLAEIFYKEKSYIIASHYAKQAVCVKFSLKWIAFTTYLSIRELI